MTRTKPISELTKDWSKDRIALVEKRVLKLKKRVRTAKDANGKVRSSAEKS